MLIATIVLAVLACTATAEGVSSHVRSLAQFSKENTFPYCRCNDYSPESSPYVLLPFNSSGITTDGISYGEFCFALGYNGANPSASACYQSLDKSLDKIIFAIQPACRPAFDTTGRYITVNGIRKTSSWRITDFPLGSVLELFNLKLSPKSEGINICVRAASPCDSPENFFDAQPVSYALVESSSHKCCSMPNFVKKAAPGTTSL